MISFDDFINKYNGKGIDFDGAYGDQCADLMNQYLVEVLGVSNPIQHFPGNTAFQIYTNAGDPRFEKIPNTPTGVPEKGDIVFWDTTLGPAGHVAVFISGNDTNFTSFDQNFPTGSLCHKQNHDYRSVVGWLHYKGGGSVSNMYGTPNQYDLSNPESMKVAVDVLNKVQTGFYVEKSKYDADLAAAKNSGNQDIVNKYNQLKQDVKSLIS